MAAVIKLCRKTSNFVTIHNAVPLLKMLSYMLKRFGARYNAVVLTGILPADKTLCRL